MEATATRQVVFFATGAAATTAQVLLLRELIADVAGDEAAIGVGLGLWLAGIALGASAARRRPAAASGRDAGLGLAMLAALPVVVIVVGRVLLYTLAPPAGELPGLAATIALAAATLLPVGVAAGWTFTTLACCAAHAWRGGEAIARLYVVEALGSLAGGLAVTLAAGRSLPVLQAALVGGAVGLVAVGAAQAGFLRRSAVPGAAAFLCVLAALAAAPLDAWSERTRFAGTAPAIPFLAGLDTPHQHLALGGGEVRHLYSSGQYVATFPDSYGAESLGHLMALLAPQPRSVLLLGGVERGIVPVLLRHGLLRLTLVDPDAAALAFLRPHLAQADRDALGDRRVTVVHDDARRFLARTDGGRFDLVLLLEPDPTTLLRARLATVEFYRLVASRLNGDGALVVSLPAVPTVLTGETESLAGTVVRSLREAFPVVRVALSAESFAVAGRDPHAVTLDPAALAARWAARGVDSPSFGPALIPLLLPPDRVAAQQAALERVAARLSPSRDDRPVSFLHALARRQGLVSGGAGGLLRFAASLPPLLLAALTFVPSAVVPARVLRRPRGSARAGTIASHAVAVAGAAGLGWSLLLLFSFQTQVGALYGALGALVAAFMLGLALGGGAAWIAWQRGGVGGVGPSRSLRALRLALAAAVAFGVLAPVALRAVTLAFPGGGIAVGIAHAILLLAAGMVTGGVFPLAAELRLAAGDAAGQAAGRLETADHVGAALSALLGAVFFVPRLGLAGTALLLAALLLSALASTALSVE